VVVASSFGLGTSGFFSLVGFGAFRGGAAGRWVTRLPVVEARFGLTSFSGCLGEPSSAFLLIPLSGDGVTGGPGRRPDLLTSRAGRSALALNGLAGGFGGAGDLSLPIELRMSLKKLMMAGPRGDSEVVEESGGGRSSREFAPGFHVCLQPTLADHWDRRDMRFETPDRQRSDGSGNWNAPRE
jgi:hypothetical protein